MALTARQENELFSGAAAYDLYGGQTAHAVPQREALPQDLPQAEPRRAVRRKGNFLTAVSCLAAACVMLLVLFAHQHLYEVTCQVAELESEFTAAQEQNVQLRSQYDNAVDLTTVEQVATTQLGMSRPAAGQTVYVNISGADRGEVLQKKAGGILTELSAFVGNAFATLGAYLF